MLKPLMQLEYIIRDKLKNTVEFHNMNRFRGEVISETLKSRLTGEIKALEWILEQMKKIKER